MRIVYRFSDWLKKGERAIYLEYGLLAMLILLPLFKWGYVFALDLAPLSRFPFPSDLAPEVLLKIILWLVNFIIPASIIYKILFFLVIFLGGAGMHRLLVGTLTKWSRYFAGLLYIFNPLVYSRFLYGQIGFLLGYALFPWLVFSILKFLRRPSWREAVKVGLWFTAISIVSLHACLVYSFFFAIIVLFYLAWSWREMKAVINLLKFVVIVIFIFAAANSYWLVPFLTRHTELAKVVATFDNRDIIGFQTAGDRQINVLWNTAAMYGFWGDKMGRYVVQKEFIKSWFWLYLVILFLAIWGLLVNWWSKIKRASKSGWRYLIFRIRKKIDYQGLGNKVASDDQSVAGQEPWLVLALFISGLVALILAVGVAHPWTASISWWLYGHVPFYRGFREPQKWIMLLVFVYAYLGALAVDGLIYRLNNFSKRIKEKRKILSIRAKIFIRLINFFRQFAPILFLVIPLLYSPGMAWGFSKQLCVSDYPQDWLKVNELLNRDQDDFQTLFLPWHMYLSLSFACNQVVRNPADNFFDKPIIAGDNMEFGSIYTQSIRPESKYIEEEVLSNKTQFVKLDGKDGISLGEKLLPPNVKYVVWAFEADFFNYDFVDKSPDLELIYNSDKIKVYKNLKWQP